MNHADADGNCRHAVISRMRRRHGEVLTPPEGIYTAERFVSHFKDEMKNNEYRISDWVEHGEQFALRLADIRVGDDTLAYGTWLRFNKWRQGLFAKRTFPNWGLVRPSNDVFGGTVDFSGKTTEVKYGQWRVVLKMDNCQVSKVYFGSQ